MPWPTDFQYPTTGHDKDEITYPVLPVTRTAQGETFSGTLYVHGISAVELSDGTVLVCWSESTRDKWTGSYRGQNQQVWIGVSPSVGDFITVDGSVTQKHMLLEGEVAYAHIERAPDNSIAMTVCVIGSEPAVVSHRFTTKPYDYASASYVEVWYGLNFFKSFDEGDSFSWLSRMQSGIGGTLYTYRSGHIDYTDSDEFPEGPHGGSGTYFGNQYPAGEIFEWGTSWYMAAVYNEQYDYFDSDPAIHRAIKSRKYYDYLHLQGAVYVSTDQGTTWQTTVETLGNPVSGFRPGRVSRNFGARYAEGDKNAHFWLVTGDQVEGESAQQHSEILWDTAPGWKEHINMKSGWHEVAIVHSNISGDGHLVDTELYTDYVLNDTNPNNGPPWWQFIDLFGGEGLKSGSIINQLDGTTQRNLWISRDTELYESDGPLWLASGSPRPTGERILNNPPLDTGYPYYMMHLGGLIVLDVDNGVLPMTTGGWRIGSVSFG